MARRIQITAGSVTVKAVLNDTSTADGIWEALPLESSVNTWGDEIYFSIPVQLPEADDARQDMEVGELGYWPGGTAFCVFFGPTPVSQGETPRAYANVNPVGMVDGDSTLLRSVKDGVTVRLEEEG